MRRAAAVLLISIGVLLPTASAGSSLSYRVVGTGTGFYVGSPLACVAAKLNGGENIALNCLERNAKTDNVFGNSFGVAMVAGTKARVELLYYAKDGKATAVYNEFQPQYRVTALFPVGRSAKTFDAQPGDRLAIGGTDILCVVLSGPKLFCVDMNVKKISAVPLTYGLYATGKQVEIGRVNKQGGFDPVQAYKEPKFKS